MGAIATGFNTVFADGANVSLASARGLGATIETYLSAPYTLNYNAAASPTSAPSGYIQRLVGKDADAYQMLVVDGFGGIPTLRARRANGTGAAPTAVVSSDVVGRMEFSGYYTSGGAAYATNPASVRGEATENWSSTAQGSRVVVATTPNTTATPADALFIGQDQSVLAKGNLGYITGQGAGGTVSQATSRTTGVTLNAVAGQITLFSGAGSSAGQSFVLTNNKIKSTSLLLINIAGSPTGLYYFGVKIGSGSATITVFNPGNNNEQPVLSFIVLDGATN
jgi:hypothetical protein